MKEILRDFSARFLNENSNNSSLLTVTKVELTSDGKNATIFFTVFPVKPKVPQLIEDKTGVQFEKTALEFVKRKRSDLRDYLKENSKLGRIPHIDFEIDLGEKNRQKIDELLNQ